MQGSLSTTGERRQVCEIYTGIEPAGRYCQYIQHYRHPVLNAIFEEQHIETD
jgi:hypothetical protein